MQDFFVTILDLLFLELSAPERSSTRRDWRDPEVLLCRHRCWLERRHRLSVPEIM